MRGKWHGQPYHDIANRVWLVSFELDSPPAEYDKTKDKPLTIEVKEHKEKRSLDANAYCWVLCSEIAKVAKTSKDEVHEEMIQRYAPFDRREDGGYITVTMLSTIPVTMLGGHWKKIDERDKFSSYMKLVGSSEMDTGQMSHFLDGVVSEAKELEIETDTPEQIERMKSLWKAS